MTGIVVCLVVAVGGILMGAWGIRRRDIELTGRGRYHPAVSEFPCLPLTTARLTLRALRAADAPMLASYRDDAEVARFQDWPMPFSLAAAEALVAEQEGVVGPRVGDWVQIGHRACG